MWFLNTSYLETIQIVKGVHSVVWVSAFFVGCSKSDFFLLYFIGFLTSINYMDK